jgi:hypothetical protein
VIRNYTPHPISLSSSDASLVVIPSHGVARVADLPRGSVVGLPDPAPGVILVVSILVAERLPERDDLRVPGQQARDAGGRVVGCSGLEPAAASSPALEALRLLRTSHGMWLMATRDLRGMPVRPTLHRSGRRVWVVRRAGDWTSTITRHCESDAEAADLVFLAPFIGFMVEVLDAP